MEEGTWYGRLMYRFFWFLGRIGRLVIRVPYPRKIAGHYRGIPVVLSQMACWEHGMFGVPFAIAIRNGWNRVPTIIINKQMVALPAEILEGVLAHEAGHLELGHLDEALDSDELDEIHQIEADRWALERHGQQYLDAMVYLRKWHDSESLQYRLEVMERLVSQFPKKEGK
jgi:hypothetical protein